MVHRDRNGEEVGLFVPPCQGRGEEDVTAACRGQVNQWQDGRAPPRIAPHQVRISEHGEVNGELCTPKGEEGGGGADPLPPSSSALAGSNPRASTATSSPDPAQIPSGATPQR